MTVGVYGIVAGIVKLDDAGLHLSEKSGSTWRETQRAIGGVLLNLAPYLMKGLSSSLERSPCLWSAAVFSRTVFRALMSRSNAWLMAPAAAPGIGGMLEMLASPLLNAVAGIVAGAVVLLGVKGVRQVIQSIKR